MGPSGSGKSTLLNLLAGIDRPTQRLGAHWRHRDQQSVERALAAWRARTVGFIFQLYNLIPVLTAFENVELPLLLTNLSKSQRRDHVMTALGIVGLGDREKHYPRSSRRTGTARRDRARDRHRSDAAARRRADRRPRREVGGEVLTLLQRLNQEFKKTIVMVTHDPHAAERATHILHLEKGTAGRTARGDRHRADARQAARDGRNVMKFIGLVLKSAGAASVARR
jgi:putative ABC transport system ATP-binding protein